MHLDLTTLLMAKYSDLVSDRRSPKNFYEQIAHLRGQAPVNIFATINNLLVINHAETATHAKLEAAYLSDRLRDRLTRERGKAADNLPMIVFTRFGALLNLKILLATPRQQGSFKRSTVGACAVHANDYIESVDASDLSRGLLPIVAEFGATWEFMNHRDTGSLLRRFSYIYRNLLLRDSTLSDLLTKNVGCRAEDLRFASLTFERYFALVFGLYATVRQGVVSEGSSLIDSSQLLNRCLFTKSELASFMTEKAMTADPSGLTESSLKDHDAFAAAIASPAWCSDFRGFRNRPLLLLPDGRHIVLDIQFLVENASEGLRWTIAAAFAKEDRNLFFSCWGSLFETYVQNLLRHYFNDACALNVVTETSEADVVLRSGDDLFVFEIKAGLISQDVKGSRDRDLFDQELRKKYVLDRSGQAKGVRQLSRTTNVILRSHPDFAGVKNVYPVLVAEDPVMQTMAMNSYLDEIFRKECEPNASTKPLTLVTVDELEEILPHIAAGDATWQELLEARFVDGNATIYPMHTSFATFANRRGFARRRDTFLSSEQDEINRILDVAFERLTGHENSDAAGTK